MEKIDILIFVISIGFTFMCGLMIVMWNSINSRMDRLEKKMEGLDEKLTDVDRRLCRLEGAFASKDCCMIKDERQMKKAE